MLRNFDPCISPFVMAARELQRVNLEDQLRSVLNLGPRVDGAQPPLPLPQQPLPLPQPSLPLPNGCLPSAQFSLPLPQASLPFASSSGPLPPPAQQQPPNALPLPQLPSTRLMDPAVLMVSSAPSHSTACGLSGTNTLMGSSAGSAPPGALLNDPAVFTVSNAPPGLPQMPGHNAAQEHALQFAMQRTQAVRYPKGFPTIPLAQTPCPAPRDIKQLCRCHALPLETESMGLLVKCPGHMTSVGSWSSSVIALTPCSTLVCAICHLMSTRPTLSDPHRTPQTRS